jgi:4-amino-4-deoxy-L-arabinose transferase-like glycosyltransferase
VSRAEAFAARLLARPARSAAWFIGLHAAAWWLVPHLAQANLPLDVIEQIAWAREPQWIYHKHPPLPAWLLAGADWISGGSAAVIQLLAPLALAIAFWSAWRLGCRLLAPSHALVALLLLEGVTFFSFQAAEFNHNSVQLPLWGLSALACWQAVTRDRWQDWALLGLWAALAVYGKYFAGFLLLALLLFLLLDPVARRCWRRPGPWIAGTVCLLALLPHLLALWRLDFLPLSYALERTAPAEGLAQRLWFPLEFALAQALGVAGTLLALWLLPRGGSELLPAAPADGLARRFLLTIAFGPCLLVLSASLLLGAEFRALWGLPLWLFLPLGVLALWPRRVAPQGLLRGLAVVLVVGLGSLAFYLGYLVYPAMTGRVSRLDFPGPALAEAAEETWRRAAGERPLAFVAGPVWEAGNVAFYGSRDALVVIDGDLDKSYWLAPAELAAAGVLLVWPSGEDPQAWIRDLERRTGLVFQAAGQATLAWQRGATRVAPLGFGFGVLLPATD